MEATRFIHNYFNLEKQGGMLIGLNGLVAFAGAGYFLCESSSQSEFYRGMSWPLLVVAVFQILVGTYLYFRSSKDLNRVESFYKQDRASLTNVELPRIKKVMASFVWYVRIQVSLCILGVFTIIVTHDGPNFVMGLGVGVLIQAAIMMMFDYLAERRAGEYFRQLVQEIQSQ
jgi:hypothetical protein